jgi:cobalt/nickel transport system permease protein
MCAILAIQALVFQDGGILALGANVFNMALAGVLAGYLPYHLWGRGRGRRAAIFAGGALSLMTSAILALAELLISGVRMPGRYSACHWRCSWCRH